MSSSYKKAFSLLLLIVLLLVTIVSYADTPTYGVLGDATYEINNGEVTILKWTNTNSKKISIPDKIEGYPVVAIADNAFKDIYFPSVKLPQYLKRIGANAFSRCNTTTLTLPKSLEYIGDNAFFECEIKKVDIPASVEYIGTGAFTAAKSITVNKNNSHYFTDKKGVLFDADQTILMKCPISVKGKYEIPSSVKIIDQSAFSRCALTEITIPEGVEEIRDNAFFFVNGITSISIPSSVRTIGECAFQFCKKLMNVELLEGIEIIDNWAFNQTNIISITIPKSVTSIGAHAFSDLGLLKTITFMHEENDPIILGIDIDYDDSGYEVFDCNPYNKNNMRPITIYVPDIDHINPAILNAGLNSGWEGMGIDPTFEKINVENDAANDQ